MANKLLSLNGSVLLDLFTELNVTAADKSHIPDNDFFKEKPWIKYLSYVLYSMIFLIGMFGNILVIYVVLRFKNMRTITNRFIACLSISDLLICLFAIPFTPINAFMSTWIFGKALCKLVPIIQGISVFVSTLTSVVIALDRYIVIVHPHTPRMTFKMQVFILAAVWVLSSSTAIPIGLYISLSTAHDGVGKECRERWPNTHSADVYTWVVFMLQLVVPSFIISTCYIRVSYQLHMRSKARHGSRDYQREKMEAHRNRRVNRMLIAMITIFIICWLPLNVFHLQLISQIIPENYKLLVFISFHLIAMSSVMYNPFLYGWMNENFNKHFRDLWNSLRNMCCCKICKAESSSINGSPITDISDARISKRETSCHHFEEYRLEKTDDASHTILAEHSTPLLGEESSGSKEHKYNYSTESHTCMNEAKADGKTVSHLV